MSIITLAIAVLLAFIVSCLIVDEPVECDRTYTRYKVLSYADGKYKIILFDIPDIDLFIDELRKQLEDRNLNDFSIDYKIEDVTFSIPLEISTSNVDNTTYTETIIKQSILEVCNKIKRKNS